MAQGYWKAIAAIKKLSVAAKVLEDAAKKVADQASALADPRPKFYVPTPNLMQQADLLFSVARQTASRMQFSDMPIPLSTRLVATKSPKL